jgi:hypothetical protein
MEINISLNEELKPIMDFIKKQAKVIEIQHKEILSLKVDRWMSVDEVSAYTGFGPKWVTARKEKFGFFQDGKDIKFKKSNVDAYMKRNSIEPKIK